MQGTNDFTRVRRGGEPNPAMRGFDGPAAIPGTHDHLSNMSISVAHAPGEGPDCVGTSLRSLQSELDHTTKLVHQIEDRLSLVMFPPTPRPNDPNSAGVPCGGSPVALTDVVRRLEREARGLNDHLTEILQRIAI